MPCSGCQRRKEKLQAAAKVARRVVVDRIEAARRAIQRRAAEAKK